MMHFVLVLSALAASVGFGLLYMSWLRRWTDGIARPRPQVILTLALRLAAAILFFGILARLGAPYLLAGLVGFLAARMAALYAIRSHS